MLMADKAKMNRTSAKAPDLTFIGPNREVQHLAEKHGNDSFTVPYARMPGSLTVLCTFIPFAIFVASVVSYELLK